MNHEQFVSEARKHQEEFMRTLGEGIDCYTSSVPEYKSANPLKKVWLIPPKAKEGLVFYEGIRDEVMALPRIRRRAASGKDMLLCVMLRSEHIPYNLFYPLAKEAGSAAVAEVFNQMAGFDHVAMVNDILFEHAPAEKYLNDNTAFDVYVDYTDKEGERCGIGIEVKYTEKEYDIKPTSKEWLSTHAPTGKPLICPDYLDPTRRSGYYREGVEALLVTDFLRQIWRNHLLGSEMKQAGKIKRFFSVIIYPEKNTHFALAEDVYRATMTEEGNRAFGTITYERFISLLKSAFPDDEHAKWIKYLEDRYLF